MSVAGGAKIAHKKAPFQAGYVAGAAFTVGAEAADVITVNVQLNDGNRHDVDRRCNVRWYLSDDAYGDSLAATAASGGVAAGTDGVVYSSTAGKTGWATSESDGDIDFAVTDNGARSLYLVLVMPDGSLAVSGALTFA